MTHHRGAPLSGVIALSLLLACAAEPDPGTPHESPSLDGLAIFPPDNPWNVHIDDAPVDPDSDALIASIGLDTPLHADFGADWNGGPFGIPYAVVPGDQPRVPVTFEYAAESDPGPYPIPPDVPIEGGADAEGDRHVIVIDRDARRLYELFAAHPDGDGWRAGSGAVFDLTSNALRPEGWTSADAAGLPILPGLARYDEAASADGIRHALRFTARRTRRAYVSPATHFASTSTDPALPPMGMRVRLKAAVDLSGFPPQARAVLIALRTYGMLLADNGSDWYISGAPDARWSDDDLRALARITGRDLEVVRMGPLTTE